MKYALPFLAALAFAPADLARAGSDGPVLEIVTFRLVAGADTEQFLSAARGTEAMLRERGALTRRFLTMDDTGLWTDVIEWTSMGEALAAAEAVMAHLMDDDNQEVTKYQYPPQHMMMMMMIAL